MLSQEEYEYICNTLYIPAYLDEEDEKACKRLYTVGELMMIMAKDIEDLQT